MSGPVSWFVLLINLQNVLDLLVDLAVRREHRGQAHTDTRCAVRDLDRLVREVRRNRCVLSIVSGLRKLDVDLEPERRLFNMNFTAIRSTGT